MPGVIPVQAGRTGKDAEITRAFAKYGRNRVPFYVQYGENGAGPVIQPEMLTPAIVPDTPDSIMTVKKEEVNT